MRFTEINTDTSSYVYKDNGELVGLISKYVEGHMFCTNGRIFCAEDLRCIAKNLDKLNNNLPFTGWIAIPDLNDDEDEERSYWCIAPRDYWEKYCCIPDHSGPDVPGFLEAMEHTYELDWQSDCEPEDAQKMLADLGFEVLDVSAWLD